MSEWKDIEKANSEMVLFPIERKDKKTGKVEVKMYAPVNERVKAFRKTMPTGRITAQILQDDEKIIVVQAFVYGTDGELLATGFAYEVKNGSYINQTSYLENCETSAVGRALGFAGFGIDTAIASAEELSGAQAEQERIRIEELRKAPIGISKAITLQEDMEKLDVNVKKVCDLFHVTELAALTQEQYNDLTTKLEKERDKRRKNEQQGKGQEGRA